MEWDELPAEIQDKIKEESLNQGADFSEERMISSIYSDRSEGGFNWRDSSQGYSFWDNILNHRELYKFCEKYPERKVNNLVKRGEIEVGDYVFCLKGRGMLHTVSKVTSITPYILKDGGGTWSKDAIRHATEKEILASKYADEYKSLIGGDSTKSSKHYEVQSKSKTDRSGHRGEAIKPRRSAVKTASSSRLVGNKISVVQRRSKIGEVKISPSLLTISRG